MALRAGEFASAAVFTSFVDLRETFVDTDVIAVDIPIGLPERGVRRADVEARRFLGRAASSVFPVPPRAVLEALTHAEASALALSASGKGISQQTFALRAKILEVDAIVTGEDNVIEVHPEVSFRALAGAPIGRSKKTWSGAMTRRGLLIGAGIRVPPDIGPAGDAATDDVLDAAVAAWSAARFARGEALSLPSEPDRDPRGRAVAIWY